MVSVIATTQYIQMSQGPTMGEKVASRGDADTREHSQQSGNYGQELVDRAYELLNDDTYGIAESYDSDAGSKYPANGIYLY